MPYHLEYINAKFMWINLNQVTIKDGEFVLCAVCDDRGEDAPADIYCFSLRNLWEEDTFTPKLTLTNLEHKTPWNQIHEKEILVNNSLVDFVKKFEKDMGKWIQQAAKDILYYIKEDVDKEFKNMDDDTDREQRDKMYMNFRNVEADEKNGKKGKSNLYFKFSLTGEDESSKSGKAGPGMELIPVRNYMG
jgi:RNA polymerase-binding transcription factor DksA